MPESIQSCISGGLGDLFITRALFDHNNIEIPINICKGEIMYYRGGNFQSAQFSHDIAIMLFKNANLIDPKKYTKINYQEIYKFKKDKEITLQKYFNLPAIKTNDIVIHTKVRADNDYEKVNYYKEVLRESFRTKKFDCDRIIILGERSVSENIESDTHKQTSIYDEIMLLENNNNILDLTEQELYNIPNYHKFRRDIEYIATAKVNIGMGWGGNYALTWGLSSSFIQWVGTINHPFVNEMVSRNNDNKQNIRNFNIFLNEINKL